MSLALLPKCPDLMSDKISYVKYIVPLNKVSPHVLRRKSLSAFEAEKNASGNHPNSKIWDKQDTTISPLY
jgi:hypothetical protein